MTDFRRALLALMEPRFVIAMSVIALFGWAFGEDVADDTMKGALIAGFAGAWGYYLGSSRGATESAARTDKALDIAHNAQQAAGGGSDGTIREGDAVTIEKRP